jgi:hypothetical protein
MYDGYYYVVVSSLEKSNKLEILLFNKNFVTHKNSELNEIQRKIPLFIV